MLTGYYFHIFQCVFSQFNLLFKQNTKKRMTRMWQASTKSHILWKLHMSKQEREKSSKTQWPNSSWTFAPCRWVRMQTRSLFIGVSEFAAETSAPVRSTASGHAIPVRVTCGTVTRMMAAHDESESSRQRDGWKEDRQRRAGLPQALDDSNSFPKKKSLYIVLIKPAHFLINWALNWFA